MYTELQDALCKGLSPRVTALVTEALAQGADAAVILNDGLLAGMRIVGEEFGTGKRFIPEVMLAARAMQAGVEVLRPHLTAADAQGGACVVLGTVLGDQHDIGKNLVKIMLEGAGFRVVDLGVNVSPESFVFAAKEAGARLIAASALLTTTMPQMALLTELAHAEGLLVMIGGAPVTELYAKKIGADGYSADAAGAAMLAKKLLAQ